jgi:hypothetical protein
MVKGVQPHLSTDLWVQPIGRWPTRKSADSRRYAKRKSTAEVGQSTIGNESRVSFREF